MQTLLLPAVRSWLPPLSSLPCTVAWATKSSLSCIPGKLSNFDSNLIPHPSLFSSKLLRILYPPYIVLRNHGPNTSASAANRHAYSYPNDETESAKLAQVSARLVGTSRSFKRFGSFGFWGQLICTVVAAVILSFSVVITGKITSPATFYATAGGIAAAFISVFWSFGYIRLSERLQKTANDPSKAPPRQDVIRSLKNGIGLNLLGMGAAILGMQSTIGLLVAKALTTSVNPYYQGPSGGSNPVLALDVFLVQASANTILSHFIGLVSSLELLRSVTLPESAPRPKVA